MGQHLENLQRKHREHIQYLNDELRRHVAERPGMWNIDIDEAIAREKAVLDSVYRAAREHAIDLPTS